MQRFYEAFDKIEKILDKHFDINDLGEGLFTINDHHSLFINSVEQMPMLSCDFFAHSDMQTIQLFSKIFQKIGLLPSNPAAIPLIQDIPLRMQNRCSEEEQQRQQQLCAANLMDGILPMRLSTMFPEDFQLLRDAIIERLTSKQPGKAYERIALDDQRQPLSSGGYDIQLHTINQLNLWMRVPESDEESELDAVADRALCMGKNSNVLFEFFKPKLLTLPMISFNVRGIDQNIESIEDFKSEKNLGGGHQHLLLLDRSAKRIYAINDSRIGEGENDLAFRQQLQLFLRLLGDETDYGDITGKEFYETQFIRGKSRQPIGKSYINQSCNVSQFIDYLAILSGVEVQKIRETIPPKIFTLLYVLQYAFTHQELFPILDNLAENINSELGQALSPTIARVEKQAIIEELPEEQSEDQSEDQSEEQSEEQSKEQSKEQSEEDHKAEIANCFLLKKEEMLNRGLDEQEKLSEYLLLLEKNSNISKCDFKTSAFFQSLLPLKTKILINKLDNFEDCAAKLNKLIESICGDQESDIQNDHLYAFHASAQTYLHQFDAENFHAREDCKIITAIITAAACVLGGLIAVGGCFAVTAISGGALTLPYIAIVGSAIAGAAVSGGIAYSIRQRFFPPHVKMIDQGISKALNQIELNAVSYSI